IELTGLLDIDLRGGGGKDAIAIDFGGAGGFTNDDDDPLEANAQNRSFRLRIDGGDGADVIGVNLSNTREADVGATFSYDVAIEGGAGNDTIMFVGVNPLAGSDNGPGFGPAGAVQIDGGFGTDQLQVFGNFLVELLNSES